VYFWPNTCVKWRGIWKGRVEEKSSALVANNVWHEVRFDACDLPFTSRMQLYCVTRGHMSAFRIRCWHYRFSWRGSLRIAVCFFFSRRSPTWERRFHFVCWWEFRKVLAVLPFGRWTRIVNWVKYLRRVDLCLFTSRHGMTSQKTCNLQQHHCENRKFHILFGVIKTRVRFDMHGNYYYVLFRICSWGDCP
jgi:hypothetical protein